MPRDPDHSLVFTLRHGNSPRASGGTDRKTTVLVCAYAGVPHMVKGTRWLQVTQHGWASEKIMLQPEGVLQCKTCIG